jgi:ABC-2 type transport system ATP-binding protein
VRSGSISDLVSNRTTAFARAADLNNLARAVKEYPEALSSRVEGEGVSIDLKTPDPAMLNRYLSERGIYLSHLSLRQQSLEDLFFEVTADAQVGSSAEAA